MIFNEDDAFEMSKILLDYNNNSRGPSYIRLTGEPGYPLVYDKDYKYTFKPNVSFMSKYNDYIYKIETNNFGYRDEKIRKIKHSENLYLFAGDSFLEGVGLNFEDTLLGHLNNKIKKKKILLNSGMASYSPFIYKKKIISFIENNQNHKPERVVIIFDKSDPMDDQQYLNHTGKFKENT